MAKCHHHLHENGYLYCIGLVLRSIRLTESRYADSDNHLAWLLLLHYSMYGKWLAYWMEKSNNESIISRRVFPGGISIVVSYCHSHNHWGGIIGDQESMAWSTIISSSSILAALFLFLSGEWRIKRQIQLLNTFFFICICVTGHYNRSLWSWLTTLTLTPKEGTSTHTNPH
jgi:hypothetical protein